MNPLPLVGRKLESLATAPLDSIMNTETTDPFARELSVALGAAAEAGVVVSAYYRELSEFELKPSEACDGSASDPLAREPVTIADRAANALILERLTAAFPEDAILSEEGPPIDWRLRQRRCWFVDPLDGTREFLDHTGEFAVMIGLAVAGHPVLGVVVVPATPDTLEPWAGRAYVGRPGHGCSALPLGPRGRLVGPSHEGNAVRVSELSDVRRATLLLSRTSRAPALDSVLEGLGRPRTRACSSMGAKVAMLVSGFADGGLHLVTRSRPKLWDLCAPDAILVAAGGKLGDAAGIAVDYASPEVAWSRDLILSNGALHETLLRAVSPHAAASPATG